MTKRKYRRIYRYRLCVRTILVLVICWLGGLALAVAEDVINTDYQQGLNFLAKNQKQQALKAFQRAVAQDSTLANAHFSIGMLKKEQEQWLSAKSALKRAIEADPDYIAPYCALAELQIEVFAQVLAAINLLKTRLGVIQIGSISPHDTTKIYQLRKWLGIAYFRNGQFQKAEAELAAANQSDLTDLQTAYILGITLVRIGDLSAAAQKFEDLISRDPFHKKAYFSLGNVYRQLGQPDLAHRTLQRFQEIDLEDERIAHLEQVVKQYPTHVDAWSQLGRIYTKRQQWEKAITALQQLVALVPTNPAAHEALGFVYFNKGDYRQAGQHYQQIVQLSPDNATYRNSLGSIYLMLEQYQEAIQQLKVAAELAPENPEIYRNLATAYQQAGEKKLAEETSWQYQKLIAPVE
ncbi:hypothetical protein CMK14_02560 [Candidatus Poribacteria bacterium]|nr:hypothetical protein [Candidatus Poribacteria bacterium]